jgi:Stage II sporulation protein E (SpoIIE)
VILPELRYAYEIDEAVSDAVRLLATKEKESPEDTYHLLAVLLRGFDDYAPGQIAETAQARLAERLERGGVTKLQNLAKEIRHNFKLIVLPTYTAASYWSPFDQKRRTVTHRPEPLSKDDKRRVLAYAYAFYALTHAGARRSNGLFSAIQFIATRAKRKRGLNVCYLENPPANQVGGWWHIPPEIQERVLDETGISEIVNHGLIASKLTINELESLVARALSRNNWIDYGGIASDYLNKFSRIASVVSSSLTKAIHETQILVSEVLGSQIRQQQALFMLLTHVMYTRACPTNYIYTFPVRVDDTCCVMTVGTKKQLPAASTMCLSRAIASIFAHPLMLDYKYQHRKLQRNIDVYAFSNERIAQGAPPCDGNFEVYGKCRPSEQLGGDFFDIVPLNESRFLCVIGDATGHGLPAAFRMAILRAFAWSSSRSSKISASEVVQTVSRLVAGMDIKVFGGYGELMCATVDTVASALHYSSAGGIVIAHYRLQLDKFDFLEATTLPLGLAEEAAEAHVVLEPGDVVVFATDASRETVQHTKPEVNWQVWIEKIVRSRAGKSAEEICMELVKQICKLRDSILDVESRDDVTVLVLKKNERHPTAEVGRDISNCDTTTASSRPLN